MTRPDTSSPRFLDWSEPILPVVARELADRAPSGPALRLDSLVLVLPGRRPARRLTELLVEEAETRSRPLVPPSTVTVGVLPELLYEPERPLAEAPLCRHVWSRTLRDASSGELEPVLPEPPDRSDLSGWAAIARLVHRLHREVGGRGLGFADVAGVCRRAALGFDDSARWEALAPLQERYLARLAELGRADREQERARAVDADRLELRTPDRDPGPEIHLVGVVEMPGLVRTMLRSVAATGTAVVPWVHAPASRTDGFDDLGCLIPEAWTDARITVPDEVISFADRPADQASEALRALSGIGSRYAADEVTVGVPDETLVPWLEQRFTAYDVPHRNAAGTPLERTGPYRLLAAAARYLDGRRFPDLAALIRHPDVDAALETPNALVAADRHFSTRLPAAVAPPRPTDRGAADGGTHGSPGRRRRSGVAGIVAELEGERFLGPLRGPDRGLREWMPRILGLLERTYGPDPLDRNVPPERRVLEACARIRDAAAALHRLPADSDEPCDASTAIRLLLGELGGPDDAVPPEADRAAVEMLGWLELHLDDTPVLVLTGANEPRLPESVDADVFLPNHLRSELGLEDNDRRYARDAYLLTAILQARERVRIIAGRSDADGTPLRPSRLLLSGTGDEPARRLLRFLRGAENGPSPDVAPLRVVAAEDGAFQVPPEGAIPLDAAPDAFRVTEFRALLADPYRWALERRLGGGELHDGARELDPLEFGSLAHRVLEQFGASDELHVPDVEAVSRRLDRLLDEAARKRFGSLGRTLPAVPLQVEQLRARLRGFARWHVAWLERGWRVVATEAGPAEGVPFDVDGVPVRLRGRIDRIDVRSETGEIAVFDYKTGESATDPGRAHRSRSGEWRDLQLPLYRHLLPHLSDREGAPLASVPDGADPPPIGSDRIRLGYVCLPKEEEKVGAAFLEWSDELLAAADEEARRLIRWLRRCDAVAFDPERSSPRARDPLAALLGRGVLAGPHREDDG